jgi:hypothetical protein
VVWLLRGGPFAWGRGAVGFCVVWLGVCACEHVRVEVCSQLIVPDGAVVDVPHRPAQVLSRVVAALGKTVQQYQAVHPPSTSPAVGDPRPDFLQDLLLETFNVPKVRGWGGKLFCGCACMPVCLCACVPCVCVPVCPCACAMCACAMCLCAMYVPVCLRGCVG